jgi:hypothetical protein
MVTAGLWAQTAGIAKPKPVSGAKPVATETAVPAAAKDLPVCKVVLYKNGVGYFEHAGTVTGTQKVSIDFTSAQLNDVLQSLTVLDEGGGRIGGVNYNSATPIEQQLNLIGLGLKEFPPTLAIYQAFRGQRVEVTGAGAAITGRLVNIEFRRQTGKNGENTEDHFYLIVATDGGALRTAELTDAVSVRMLDASKQKQLTDYLKVLAGAADQQARHVTFEDAGQGQRAVRVSYISEVPVWKSTYRIVFPKDPNGKATLQGWAVVDNTVGADWENVQLSLVAGAPQSFIQPLSQPLYTHRPEIPIAVVQQNRPTTHAAAEFDRIELGAKVLAPEAAVQPEMMNDQRTAPTRIPRNVQMAREKKAQASFGVAGMSGLGGAMANAADMPGGGGVYRASDATSGEVATKAFDDFFEYALTQSVTIHKNESAMVPILQQDLPAQHVTLWSERDPTPLRAVWLENASKLTLDQGSFSIFESGEFAGEGLLDPIHPGERRLMSYAADQAVQVRVAERHDGQKLHHVSVQKGAVVETTIDEATVTYAVTNSGDADRSVLIESPRKGGAWTLDESLKADETSADVYRFKVGAAAHSTAKLEVRQHGPQQTRVQLSGAEDQTEYLLELVKRAPGAMAALQPVIDAQTAIAKIQASYDEQSTAEESATADEARVRENLTALKGNEAAKRYVEELNHAEDALQAAHKRQTELEAQKQAAIDKLDKLIAGLTFDWDVQVTTK